MSTLINSALENELLTRSRKIIDDDQANILSTETSETIQIKNVQGVSVTIPIEALLHLVLIEKTGYIDTEGRKLANDIDSISKKIKLLDTLYKEVFELSEKDGSLAWEKKGLGPSIEALRNEGFVIPAKKGVLPREERDALLRSLSQQRDDLSTQANQLNMKVHRCFTLHDDHFRYFSGLLSAMNDSCKKIFRNVG